MRHKTVALSELKADAASGTFTALASAFGNVDSMGDRILKGAFAETLKRWRAAGDPIPVILSHQWDDPAAFVGKAAPDEVVETDEGLLVKGSLDLENPVAAQVHRLMRDRLLKGWSFGYTVPSGGEKRSNGANEISELDLIEVGPTLKGANPAAQLQTVKSALEDLRPEALAARIAALEAKAETPKPEPVPAPPEEPPPTAFEDESDEAVTVSREASDAADPFHRARLDAVL